MTWPSTEPMPKLNTYLYDSKDETSSVDRLISSLMIETWSYVND